MEGLWLWLCTLLCFRPRVWYQSTTIWRKEKGSRLKANALLWLSVGDDKFQSFPDTMHVEDETDASTTKPNMDLNSYQRLKPHTHPHHTTNPPPMIAGIRQCCTTRLKVSFTGVAVCILCSGLRREEILQSLRDIQYTRYAKQTTPDPAGQLVPDTLCAITPV